MDVASKSHFAHDVNDIALTSLKDEIAGACHCFDNGRANAQSPAMVEALQACVLLTEGCHKSHT